METKGIVIANKRILVANRGEIATRIFRAATELNMQTVAIYSHEDRFSVHRFKADEAYKVGRKGDPLGAYLDWKAIIQLAKHLKIDFIHPGYGFLSENPDFASACVENGILFCGPKAEILSLFGDKLAAKAVAKSAGVRVIPGTEESVENVDQALKIANSFGYPITLKALSGGGGKGIRVVNNDHELSESFARARSEAMSSFGRSEVYIEKNIQNARHIEVQIAGDMTGRIIHLFERDCSVQRRHQKVVEVAPAQGISESVRTQILSDALMIAKSVNYVGVGTVEFLLGEDGTHYFLEVNPRIQVEHTITEMVTGVDLVQMSIMLPAGRSLNHPVMSINSQDEIKLRGVAIQCRITSENPLKNFAADTGAIVAYRPAQGFGIRLDEGFGNAGAIVTPHYDSLLVKVTAHSVDMFGASQKMIRALKEFRIRGVKTNIPLLLNIISHPEFMKGTASTRFLDTHPEVFSFKSGKDRATRILNYIAEVTINNPHQLSKKIQLSDSNSYQLPKNELPPPAAIAMENAKSIYSKGGTKGLAKWILAQRELLITDTTMRDAHQSLFATRLRNLDIFNATPFYSSENPGFFSLEVWGGATFDTCMRFLHEDPWERLSRIRSDVPNILLQMLLRGDNAVGYTNYPEWVVRDFIRLTAEAGLDVFRIFDCLNNPEQMETAIDEVKKRGAIAEACICYTGNILQPRNNKYTLDYYLRIAAQLEKMGADILCIKDMAGLLRPKAAQLLIKALKETISIPIHLHTHATAGSSEATLLAASDAGCDIVDGAISSMSGLTSQPSINALVACLEGTERASSLKLRSLDELSRYWETVRRQYSAFDPGIQSTSTDVYEHEIPGGQYSNLFDQARRVGVSSKEFFDLTKRYADVNHLLGDIVKVTPSSKVVGDFALLLQKNNLSTDELIQKKPRLDYPDSVISFFRGHMGIPYGGFNENLRQLVLGSNPPPPEKLASDETDSLREVQLRLEAMLGEKVEERDAISYRLYPKVFLDHKNFLRVFGDVTSLPTDVFFNGLALNREIEVPLEPGKTLIISLSGITDPDKAGVRRVFFQLNGFPRNLEVIDEGQAPQTSKRQKADITNIKHTAAPMPGKVLELRVQVGDQIKTDQIIVITESMKMEYVITSRTSGKVKALHIQKGDLIQEGDLLIELS